MCNKQTIFNMTATEFKTSLRETKSNLKNVTLQLITKNSVQPYTNNLFGFGNAVLREESNGNSFSINQAWTNSGVVKINSINQLAQLLVSGTVTGIQFQAFYQTTDFAESIRHGYSLND